MRTPGEARSCEAFISRYKDKVKDYNFGSLIRTDARDEYSEKNTIFSECLRLYGACVCWASRS